MRFRFSFSHNDRADYVSEKKESIVKARIMLSNDRQLTASQDVIRTHYAASRSFGLLFVPTLRSS